MILLHFFIQRMVIMNRIKSLAFMLVLGVIFFACGEGRQDPTGIDGGSGLTEGLLTKGTDGPNLVVTLSNADSASQTINEAIFAALPKAAYAVISDPSITEPVRMMGDYSGYAVVDGSATMVETSMKYDFKLTFYDYSDDGSIYIGGSLQYLSSFVNQGDTQKIVYVNGEIKFAGPYTGFIKYNNFLLPIDGSENLISIFAPDPVLEYVLRGGSVTFNSGGNEFTLNPYPIIIPDL